MRQNRKGRRLLAGGVCLIMTLFSGCNGETAGALPQVPAPTSSVAEGAAVLPVLESLYHEPELTPAGISAPRSYGGEGTLLAGMIPHHLVAADMIAGFFAHAAEHRKRYDRVILVSPSHFPENCGSDVVTARAGWRTPYGSVKPDLETVEALLLHSGIGAEDNPRAVELDHGAAGLIPFVRYYLPDAPVSVVLLANGLDRGRLEQVQQLLAEQWSDGRTLLVASADCSHYLMPAEAAERDRETARAIEALDLERIFRFGDSNMDSPQAVTTFLTMVSKGELSLSRLDHSSSAEKLPHAMTNPVYEEGITTYYVYGGYR